MALSRKLAPDIIRSKHSRKLLLLLSTVVVVIALIGGVVYVQTGEALEANTEAHLEQATEMQSQALSEWIQRTEHQVGALATSDRVASANQSELDEQLRVEHEMMGESVVALHYVDVTGEISASTTDATGVDLQSAGVDIDGAADAEAGETVLLGPHTNPIEDRPVLAVVSPVTDGDGYVVAVIDLLTQTQVLEDHLAIDGAFTVVLDAEATTIMSHHYDRIGSSDRGHDDKHLEIVTRALSGETGTVSMERHGGDHEDHAGHDHEDHDGDATDHDHHDDGHDHDDEHAAHDHEDDAAGGHGHHGDLVMGYAPVENTEWVVMIHVPSDEAYGLQEQIGQFMLALLGVSLVGLGAIGLIVGTSTSRSLNRLAAKANELERGNLDTDLQTNRIDEFGALYDSFESMRDSLRESIDETEAARERAVEQRERLEAFANQLEAQAGEVMAKAAAGDLTRRIEVDGDSPALEQVACEYNEMIDDIEQMTATLKTFASTVAAHSEEVTASAEEVQSAGESVSHSVQEISANATKQDEKLQVIADSVGDISASTEEIAAQANHVTELAEQTATAGVEGQRAADEAIDAVEQVDHESQATLEVMETLETDIDRVEEIAGIIAAFTEQMNILAVNASIEASRSAGDHDSGFAAVADEVRELSEESKAAAERIETITAEVLADVADATSEVRHTRAEITASQDTIEQAATHHEQVATYARETSDGIAEISAATQAQAASTEEIVSIVEETAELSSSVADEAGEVAAATEEQASAMSEVTDSAKDLTREADTLQQRLDRFRLSSELEPTWSNSSDTDPDTGGRQTGPIPNED